MRDIIFPYETIAGGVELTIKEARVDGKRIQVDLAEATLNLSEHATDWEKLSLQVEVSADAQNLAAYEQSHGKVDLVLVASCGPTNVRQVLKCDRSALDSSRWSGSLELDRATFRERLYVQGIAAAVANGSKHRPVGVTNRATIYLDATDSFKISGTLKVIWHDFKSPDAPAIAKQFSDAPYVVNFDQPLPEILLNTSFDGLEPLLRDSKDRSKTERALHDSLRMSIARSVWQSLLGSAMSAVKLGDDGEEAQWPDKEWQAEVLRRILPCVDPTRSETELLQLAATDWRIDPGSAAFLPRAEAAIGDLIDANKALRKTIQTLLREGMNV